MRIQLDLNAPSFLPDFLSLQKEDSWSLVKSLQKISKLSWQQFYKDGSLHWEKISSLKGSRGEDLYSFRVSQKCRVVGFRQDNFLRLMSIHPDHDSAYKGK